MDSPKHSKNNNKNFGIEILRMILCFWVISFHHVGIEKVLKYKILKTFFHVPTFMLISFYFSYNTFISNNIIKYKKRLERLLVPYIIWPIIYLIIYDSINIKKLVFNLLLQYLTGYKIYVILWFLGSLIFLELFFKIIHFLFNKKSLLILKILSIISYLIQYKEINYNIFYSLPSHFIGVARTIEMMPIAVTGLTLNNIDIFKRIKNDKIKYISYSMIIIFFIYNYKVFSEFRGFLFNGIKQNIAGICLFISFSLIPFNNIKNKIIISSINIATKYTGGIYYLQTIIFKKLIKFKYFKQRYFFRCFMIYIFGYIICSVFVKIFRNNKLKYLFY